MQLFGWNYIYLIESDVIFSPTIHKVIQRRQDGSENFYRKWSDYEFGFGSPASEVWLGIVVQFDYSILLFKTN